MTIAMRGSDQSRVYGVKRDAEGIGDGLVFQFEYVSDTSSSAGCCNDTDFKTGVCQDYGCEYFTETLVSGLTNCME